MTTKFIISGKGRYSSSDHPIHAFRQDNTIEETHRVMDDLNVFDIILDEGPVTKEEIEESFDGEHLRSPPRDTVSSVRGSLKRLFEREVIETFEDGE